ncbi:MAG: hypothetical protein JNL30_06910 [Rubrivivax sp.]|nr:hypothetical protein [Rubrivivax sp.]
MSGIRVAVRAWCLALCLALLGPAARAVSGVNPFGVNVRSNGATSVFLTFQGLDAGETAVEAYWCGELQPALMAANAGLQLPVPVQASDPCVPGSIYGRLPLALDRSRPSGSAGFANFTDVMTIPASVARRAYQDAAAGANSAFFYVRRFAGPAGDRFVVVTCRMGGGGARTALALLDVRLAFAPGRAAGAVGSVGSVERALARGEVPPAFSARIVYNGSGTLRGRWELVLPGDPLPTEEDLLTEASLPLEQRLRQRRWRLVERFEVFLPPGGGEAQVRGPDPRRLETAVDGAYQVLLRVEASDDKEASSQVGGGRVAIAGGVAGFAMPVLRYHIGAAGAADAAGGVASGALSGTSAVPIGPAPDAVIEGPLHFTWIDPPGAALLRLRVRERPEGEDLLAAFVRPGSARYEAPPWFAEAQRGKALVWRVEALGEQGALLGASGWRRLELK